jgi:hypothetical protein
MSKSSAVRVRPGRVKYWEIIADNLRKADWSWGCVSAVDSRGRTIFDPRFQKLVASHTPKAPNQIMRRNYSSYGQEIMLAVMGGCPPRSFARFAYTSHMAVIACWCYTTFVRSGRSGRPRETKGVTVTVPFLTGCEIRALKRPEASSV